MIIVFWFLMTRQIGLTRQAWAHKARLGSQGTAWAITKNKIAKKQNRKKNRKKTNVSPTPNAYFSGQQLLSRGQCVKYSIEPRSCTLQRASRLRKTYLFNKLHIPTNVSRLHQMLMFLKMASRLHQTPTLGSGSRHRASQ